MTENNLNTFLNSSILISVIIGGCVLLLTYIIRMLKNNNENNTKVNLKNVSKAVGTEKEKDSLSAASKSKKKGVEGRWTGRADKHNYTHPWLLTSLKGHTSQVLDMDFSSNGKYLASCSEDRTVLLWCVKDLEHNKERKSLRINIEFDSASLIKWSPDSKAFIINRNSDNAIEVFKVERKKDGWLGPVSKALTFPKVHEEEVIAMDIACNGRFIMTCSQKTDLVLWDLRGQELARVDTYLMSTMCAKITSCSRFIVASGFAPDVKVWEVSFGKTGEFHHVKRAFELTGHTSGIYDVAFDADTSHMATISKDGTWKIYDTKIEYAKGEDPHLKITGKYIQSPGPIHIALSPNAEVVVISVANKLLFYSSDNATLDHTIENVYAGPITRIMFDSLGKYILTAGDKHIRVFHNVTGYKQNIVNAQEKLRQHQTSATKERLQKIIAESEAFLKTIK